jgi:hypothetical protein
MFTAAMVCEPTRNSVAEVTSLLLLGDETGQTAVPPNNASAKPSDDTGVFGEMPMTTGGTIKDPPDPRTPDHGSEERPTDTALPSGAVTDLEIEHAKRFYRTATGDDLVTVITERKAAGDTDGKIEDHIRETLATKFFQPGDADA